MNTLRNIFSSTPVWAGVTTHTPTQLTYLWAGSALIILYEIQSSLDLIILPSSQHTPMHGNKVHTLTHHTPHTSHTLTYHTPSYITHTFLLRAMSTLDSPSAAEDSGNITVRNWSNRFYHTPSHTHILL